MTPPSTRMFKLKQRLHAIRLGSGAVVLPKDVKRIHMTFGAFMNNGHMGPRKFWHNELVRLKYHNPAVPMTTSRIRDGQNPDTEAIMSIHFTATPNVPQTSDSATSSPAPTGSTSPDTLPSEHEPTDRVETIDMQHRTNSEILQELLRITKAYPVEPTPQDHEEMRLMAEEEERRKRMRLRQEERREVQRKEKEMRDNWIKEI